VNHYCYADLKIGMKHSFQAEVTGEMMDGFRVLCGDTNPLHADDAYARGRDYPGKVVFGMLTASFYSTLVGVHLPGEHALLQGVDASFLAPVFPGDKLVVEGQVTYLNDAYCQAEIKASITAGGRKVSTAKIKVGLNA
jgi:3-hydroxybutyryl-CoA dehydratase